MERNRYFEYPEGLVALLGLETVRSKWDSNLAIQCLHSLYFARQISFAKTEHTQSTNGL